MSTNLLGLLGYDESDPEVQSAREDAAEHTSLIETLVRMRHERSFTQSQIAERVGTTRAKAPNFERVGGNPTLATIHCYARAVGTRTQWSIMDSETGPSSGRTE
ncbi:helix-turn-helix domain-containing protein [Haloactinomyces albus]|uniref:DNA-binding XRE family transcriptional regulator n=1 Tax=Haloactinomyces albus TaxID=1352928 RepID=A0AAE3ZCE8_9ACTN|nr:helix-turn-helix transcriptional regulator [Haloactinomyces albus]MDR7302342.1 DNA-binding XRE family transcriptional regulator [Haloactinomyces albus]